LPVLLVEKDQFDGAADLGHGVIEASERGRESLFLADETTTPDPLVRREKA
jgi:hypothetical protein